jgi:4-alpha-glucanotransferase
MRGRWIKGPRSHFFKTLQEKLGDISIIAEDLGDITPEVTDLLNELGFPGMKILQFAFGSGSGNPYLPHGYSRNCVAYTGTHDNDTTLGWFNHLSYDEQKAVERYVGSLNHQEVHWYLIRLALSSVADWTIFPLQDVLGLGSEARMNTPGTAEGNWGWRYREDALTNDLRDRLRNLTETYGRIPY